MLSKTNALFCLISLALGPSIPAGELIPFTLPWNDAAENVTDLSSLNHVPAGKFGYIGIEDAHFSLDGERIRLWGVNITSNSCFPTHEEAEAIAARLAKFGFNIVRFHHMDNNWTPNERNSLIDYSQGNSRNLDPENLEKLDYFIAQLKQHGIYSNLNLINSRDFKVADGLDPQTESLLDNKQRHVLGFVDPTFRDLEKEFVRNLLTHTNPYTGLSYAEEPAIAVVEINNENGIFQQYFDGSLSLWPNVYKNQLQVKWNDWLKARYDTTEELLEAWSGESEPLGDQLINNPDFSQGDDGWNIEQHQGAVVDTSTETIDGRAALKLDITTAGSAGWHVQLNQGGKSMAADQLYTLSFWLRADTNRSVSASIGQAYDPWGTFHSFSGLTASTEWVQHSYVFRSAVTDDNLRLNFNGFATNAGAVYFSDINLSEGGDLSASLPDGQTLESGNIANNQNSGSYRPNRVLDWTRFLIDLARDYWTDMRDYVEIELDYQGLVNGTTVMNSTPHLQGVYEFVDTHSYWQHPVFPGAQWDPNNWYVNPLSMVNEIDSTIAALAKQKIDGYPHTVSEYRHAYPNPFASEGPLLIGAYGALQDWDGVYFFDYARGSSWDQGFWNNYFNMNAHPSSMANALAAAQLFRHAHVSPAQTLTKIRYTPEKEVETVATQGRAWTVGDGRLLDIPSEIAAINRIALSIGDSASGLDTPPDQPEGPTFESDTGQLKWDLSQSGKGVVTIQSDQTRSIVGYIADRDFDLGEIAVSFGETQEDWATLTLTTRQGSFAQPLGATSVLVVATGLTENTNMQWTDASKQSVGQNWGQAPSLTEAIPATLTLPYPASRVSAWGLDNVGDRSESLTVSAAGENASTLQIGSEVKSLWYEIEISADPSINSYETWRDSHWSDPDDRTNEDVSGPNADPDGDKVSNLIEFFAQTDPSSPDLKNPVTAEVVERSGKPAFRFTLPVPLGYPLDGIQLSQAANLQTWLPYPLDHTALTLERLPGSETRETLVIEYVPEAYPAFSRIGQSQ